MTTIPQNERVTHVLIIEYRIVCAQAGSSSAASIEIRSICPYWFLSLNTRMQSSSLQPISDYLQVCSVRV
jgi:hypothetical protein